VLQSELCRMIAAADAGQLLRLSAAAEEGGTGAAESYIGVYVTGTGCIYASFGLHRGTPPVQLGQDLLFCLPARPPACRPARLHACMHAFKPSWLPPTTFPLHLSSPPGYMAGSHRSRATAAVVYDVYYLSEHGYTINFECGQYDALVPAMLHMAEVGGSSSRFRAWEQWPSSVFMYYLTS